MTLSLEVMSQLIIPPQLRIEIALVALRSARVLSISELPRPCCMLVHSPLQWLHMSLQYAFRSHSIIPIHPASFEHIPWRIISRLNSKSFLVCSRITWWVCIVINMGMLRYVCCALLYKMYFSEHCLHLHESLYSPAFNNNVALPSSVTYMGWYCLTLGSWR